MNIGTAVLPLLEFAPAKINLYLHVTGRKPDGYHLLDSLVVFAGVGDSLSFEPADDITLAISGPQAEGLEAGPGNLVVKAARVFAESARIKTGAKLHLVKNLPVSSGIGGGSADAAAALRGLIRLWGIKPDSAQLSDAARRLGADVPVCLAGAFAQMSGIGEILARPPRLPHFWMVLINPGMGLATPAVFKGRSGAFSAADPLTEAPADVKGLAVALQRRRNDLAPAAIGLVPEIESVLTAIEGQADCLIARMSGSGATCFGLFADESAARKAAGEITLAHPSWWVAAAPSFDASAPVLMPVLRDSAKNTG